MIPYWTYVRVAIFLVLLAALIPIRRYLRPFFWRITFCLLPVVISAIMVTDAVQRYNTTGGGFKLGVDLVGGTILIYEVDPDKMDEKKKEQFKPELLASRLKSRIDPTDLYNVTIRPVSSARVENTRVEIILPTGGAHQAEIERKEWQDLLDQVKENPDWAQKLENVDFKTVPRGNRAALITVVHEKTGVSSDDIEGFISKHYQAGSQKSRDVTTEQVQHIKNLIAQVGSLEFRILANEKDDEEAIKVAKAYFEDSSHKEELQALAVKGQPPPGPPPGDKEAFVVPDKGSFTYSWVEISLKERWAMGLNNAAEDPWRNLIEHVRVRWSLLREDDLKAVPQDNRPALMELIQNKAHASKSEIEEVFGAVDNITASNAWKQAKEARGKAIVLTGSNRILLYSRECLDSKLKDDERTKKKFEYFLLTRDPEKIHVAGQEKPIVKEITGDYLSSASPSRDEQNNPCIHFQFNTAGGNLFYEVTSKNTPDKDEKFYRYLAIILDSQIVSFPRLQQAIRTDGRITGNFTEEEVNDMVSILRSGALPATLKRQPVSENTMGATLGADTIRKGVIAVGMAFAAILIFMVVYYRFAGLVACIALLANLLLTIAFMVAVNATFTLPGLAGLVLMLGMAVDANVLIYERLREERERGANLALAIRNGYDRAFPTIIDTHLSSIFTAIVLYTVGNDQLKGFGISLTVGLIISLFTSLYMTRLLFDLWQAKGWLHKLSMFRLFARPNINFMGIRYYWFTATILLTIFGISVFVVRLPQGLNIDFNGGTAYGGETKTKLDLEVLRRHLDENSQKEWLGAIRAETVDVPGENAYKITYRDPDGGQTTRTIFLPNKPLEDKPDATQAEREEDVKKRAGELPDVSVEQIFPSDPPNPDYGFFTVRTSEKAPDLVQASIARLLGDELVKTGLAYDIDKNGRAARFSFTDPQGRAFASPGQVETLLKHVAHLNNFPEPSEVKGMGEQDLNGRFAELQVTWKDATVSAENLKPVLEELKKEFQERPLPDRLETFDKQLAEETQGRAMYAILGSWAAILLYLWFRFGSWTFGLAAVFCLIHDLFFTLGIIAFCHYIHTGAPALASALLIQDFKIDLPSVAALLTLVGYSTNDTIVVFDRIREVRGKNPDLTPQMINDSVNQTLSRTVLASFATWLVVFVLYVWGGEGVHLFAFVMVVGVVVGTYSSIYIASPLLLIFGEGKKGGTPARERQPEPVIARV
jgi:SecD/SecF fusion protein